MPFSEYLHLSPISNYFSKSSSDTTLGLVIVPSTLFTSLWTLLILLTSFITMLLRPIDNLRRYCMVVPRYRKAALDLACEGRGDIDHNRRSRDQSNPLALIVV
jgi:hypothetical protein